MSWFFGAIFTVVGIVGTVLASNAVDTGMYTFGLGLFAFGIWLDFWLIKDHFDTEDKAAKQGVA